MVHFLFSTKYIPQFFHRFHSACVSEIDFCNCFRRQIHLPLLNYLYLMFFFFLFSIIVAFILTSFFVLFGRGSDKNFQNFRFLKEQKVPLYSFNFHMFRIVWKIMKELVLTFFFIFCVLYQSTRRKKKSADTFAVVILMWLIMITNNECERGEQ